MTSKHPLDIASISLAEFGIADDRGASELSRLTELKAFIKTLTEEKEAIEQRLKIELGNNPDPIFDGEHGLVATLKERAGAPSFDLIAMSQKDDRLLVEAARLGLLNVRTEAVRKQKGQAEAADVLLSKYAMPGAPTFALTVERA